MCITQIVRCPNCGSHAEQHHFTDNQIRRTSCPSCDYLMVQCSRTGKVIEAYAPGIAYASAAANWRKPAIDRKQPVLLSHENSAR